MYTGLLYANKVHVMLYEISDVHGNDSWTSVPSQMDPVVINLCSAHYMSPYSCFGA